MLILEKKVTKSLHALHDLAKSKKDTQVINTERTQEKNVRMFTRVFAWMRVRVHVFAHSRARVCVCVRACVRVCCTAVMY